LLHVKEPRVHLRLIALGLVILLAACSSGGGGALSPGLSARMDQPGAELNRAEAIGIVNHFRTATGATPVTEDPSLDAAAQALVVQYIQTGNPPRQPAGTTMRTSAGYATFAETFSGWRNSPADAAVLADKGFTRAGIASRYDANSGYGVYWVLLLAK
jgi:uncharacterized protein YkwD